MSHGREDEFLDWIYRFGEFEFDPRKNSLLRNGEPVLLRPKGFELLDVLLRNAGRLVEKEQIMEAVWPNVTVGENNLTVLMAHLRGVLGDRHGNQRYIVTLPGRGYRFVGEYTRHEQTNAKLNSHGDMSTVQTERLAIASFRGHELGNLRYLETGLTDALITRISKLPHILVLPLDDVDKSSVEDLEPTAVARNLSADSLLTGSIKREFGRLRVQAHFHNLETGSIYWSDEWDCDPDRIITLEDTIATRVVSVLSRSLTNEETARIERLRPSNSVAYQAYLRGRAMWYRRTLQSIESAIREFRAAIDFDPNFAMAHAGLSDCYSMKAMYSRSNQREMLSLATSHAQHALSIVDDLAEAVTSLAFVSFLERRWGDAESQFEEAMRLNRCSPLTHQWYSDFLAAQGKFTDAVRVACRCTELDPASAVASENLGWVYYLAEQHDNAHTSLVRSLELDPYLPLGHCLLGLVYFGLGHASDAVEECERAVELSPQNSFFHGATGFVHGALGNERTCLRIASRLEDGESPEVMAADAIALCYAGIQDRENTLHWIEEAHKNRCSWSAYFAVLPQFAFLRDDPMLAALLKQSG